MHLCYNNNGGGSAVENRISAGYEIRPYRPGKQRRLVPEIRYSRGGFRIED